MINMYLRNFKEYLIVVNPFKQKNLFKQDYYGVKCETVSRDF